MPVPNTLLPLLATVAVPHTDYSAADVADLDGQTLRLTLGYPVRGVTAELTSQISACLRGAGLAYPLGVTQRIPAVQSQTAAQHIDGVKNIIAVASGKGGVGKSTVAVNIALALAHEGARVGLLDADIYGPSQPQMLGLGDQRPEVVDNRAMRPLVAHGVQMASMGSLVTENTPMVWRGPMVSGALKQLLNQTLWEDVDYLIIDMPPGTGDIQLTLSQSVPVSSSVIVTTPQDIALLDAKKGIEMFRKVNIPVAGVVENMALYVCPQCGHRDAIFGEQGGERLADEYGVRLLGQLPLQRAIREQVDSGRPPVVADPDAEVSREYRRIAMRLAADIWRRAQSRAAPEISFSDD